MIFGFSENFTKVGQV